ncbi:hypothetical protein ALNOE001_03500 [Candidatus Methanobinarius endosymbioticus]|uniref:Uncharacterized protein n=1 Tax=Candidatus Methanobinarius endosymbioticus TaxID=2006182 RepID=A0A366MEJ9_9EURY|nr:hypothetical protein ALNOE001_03500 [Candidatus Methanobinarius endosymbioticus]
MVIIIFKENLIFKEKEIPRIILGFAPFTGENYFGHRSRLYHLDLEINSENVAKIINKSKELGIKSINLINHSNLIKSYQKSGNDEKLVIIGTIGKSDIDYVNPNYEKAKKVDWEKDIKVLENLNSEIMLVDEFITDSYDWDLLKDILTKIKEKGSLAGLITAYPFKTTKKLINSPILDLFDFYMIPVNKLGYMMDTKSFMKEKRNKLSKLINQLDKKIIINKILACGIQQPEEAFNFLKTLDYVDMVAIGIASKQEAEKDFKLLKEI